MTRRHAYLMLLVLVSLVVGLLGAWCFWVEPASIRARHYTIVVPDWLASTPLRIAVLADVHTGAPYHGPETLRRIVALTNAADPDLVLLAGDYVIHGVLGGRFVAPEESAPILGGLRARYGVFAVLGNHDWWFDPERVYWALDAAGIRLLEDDAVRVSTEVGAFWLVGISDYWQGPHDVDYALEPVIPGEPVIALTHNPDVFDDVPESVQLTIAGHTHGGQVNLPWVGRLIVPSKFGQRLAIGHVVEATKHLFVSPGLGTSIVPVRFRVPPEVSVLELRGAAGAPGTAGAGAAGPGAVDLGAGPDAVDLGAGPGAFDLGAGRDR